MMDFDIQRIGTSYSLTWVGCTIVWRLWPNLDNGDLQGRQRILYNPRAGLLISSKRYFLTLKWQKGGPRDPNSVFRVFYYFHVQFFHRYFLLLSHSWLCVFRREQNSQFMRRFPGQVSIKHILTRGKILLPVKSFRSKIFKMLFQLRIAINNLLLWPKFRCNSPLGQWFFHFRSNVQSRGKKISKMAAFFKRNAFYSFFRR